MGLFKSKEEREAQEQRARKIKELQAELARKRRAYRRDVESHQQSHADRWEYLEVTTKDKKQWGSLNRLGQAGWELVSASTYEETEFGGDLAVRVLYVFKRKVYDLPDEMIGRSLELGELEMEIKELQQGG